MDNSIKMEYLFGGDLIDKTKEAARETANLSTAAERAAAAVAEQITAQKAVVSRVENDLKSLQKQYERMAPGKAQMEMEAELRACKVCLEEEKGALAALEAEHKKATTSVGKLTKEYRSLIQEMARMRLAGEEGSAQYQAMAKRAAELCDTLGDVRAQTKALASDDANWEAMASGLNGLSGAITAGTGVMSLFVGENEELARVQTRLQAVMAITMGMQQTFNALNKDSAFSTIALTKAKKLWTAVNIGLAESLGISTAAAQALMATVTLGLSVAIVGLIALWNKHNKATKDAAKAENDMVASMREGSRAAAVQKAKLDILYKATQDNTKSLKERKVAVSNLQKQYPAYFGNMKTEAILAGKAAAAYRQLADDIIKAAMARAYEKRIEKLAERQADLELSKAGLEKYLHDNKANYDKAQKNRRAEKQYTKDVTGGLTAGFAESGMAQQFAEQRIDPTIKAYDQRNKQLKGICQEMEANQRVINTLSAKVIAYNPEVNRVESKGYNMPTETKVKKEKQVKNEKEDLTNEINELGELELAARKKIEESRVALMKEGYEKQRAEELLHYEEEKQRINEEEAKRMALVQKLRKGGVVVTPEQEAQIGIDAAKQRIQAAQMYGDKLTAINEKEKKEYDDKVKEEKQKEEESLDALLSKYKDYNAERIAIETAYTKDMVALLGRRNKDNYKEIDAALAELERAKEKALKEVTNKELNEMKSSASIFVEMFENSSEKSIKQINRIMRKLADLKLYMDAMARGELNAEGAVVVKNKKGETKRTITAEDIAKMGITPEQLKRLQESPEALKAFMEQWQKLRQETLKKNPFKALGAALKDLFKKDSDEEDKGAKIKRLALTAAGCADEISKIAGGLSEMFDQIGNQSMAEAMDSVQSIMGGVSNIAKGFANGGVFGGIMAAVGETINIIGKAFSAKARHRAALAAIMQEQIAQQQAYNLLLMQEALLYERGTTAFGTDRYGKATNAISVMKKATEDFAKAWKKANDIKVVTGHKRTGLFGWGKGKDTYSTILSQYPKLIDAHGKFNVSLAESILKTRKMDDESKAALQNLIDLAKQQEEAWKEIRGYLTDIFGELGNTITNALVDAFRSGTDAGKAMAESVGKMLEKMGTDMIYSAVLQKYFLKAQKEMEKYATDEHLSEEERFAAYARILDELTAGVSADSGKAASLLEQFKRMAAERGINIFGGGAEQQGRAGSLETMTQAQGTKLEGLMTSAQIHLASLDIKFEDVAKQMTHATTHLAKIEKNTAYCQRLEGIATDIAELKRNGIKVK
ncbi:hypothetical protein HMPREF9296_0180 [Prevotella disiens FB035-09AN]|uniref:Uncharacterized protein n=1 Tax=Prevotella disiens FB035-09AN TaxID=866771 RepID=E1KUD2_9BACT|nr:hypothetical protein [Prevotella disiens]EFL44934.1 hypothetical protein HMPREF9296_0180 [Prevotella disiens FB035-09AN]